MLSLLTFFLLFFILLMQNYILHVVTKRRKERKFYCLGAYPADFGLESPLSWGEGGNFLKISISRSLPLPYLHRHMHVHAHLLLALFIWRPPTNRMPIRSHQAYEEGIDHTLSTILLESIGCMQSFLLSLRSRENH